MRTHQGNDRWMVFLAVIIILLAGGALVVSQPHGVGLSPDSMVYLESARNIWNGRGPVVQRGVELYSPVRRYPPLYPYLLAPFDYSSLSLLNGGLFVVTMTSYLLVLKRYTSPLVLLLAITSLGTHPALIELYLYIWSETLFLLQITLSMLFISLAMSKRSPPLLLSIGIVSSCQLLTRYAGAAWVATTLVWGVILCRTRRERVSLILGLSLAPLGILLFDLKQSRAFSYHPPSASVLHGAYIPIEWVFPFIADTPLHALGIIAFVYATWLLRRSELGLYLTLCIVSYIFLLGVSLYFLDAELSLYSRILAPLLPLLGALTAIAIMRGEGLVRVNLAFAIFGSQIISHIPPSLSHLADAGDGLGYRSSGWRHSPLIAALHDDSGPLASNAPEVAAFYLGYYVEPLPERYSSLSLRPNEGFATEMEALIDRRVLIACFSTVSGRWYLPRCEELSDKWHYRSVFTFPDGALLQPK